MNYFDITFIEFILAMYTNAYGKNNGIILVGALSLFFLTDEEQCGICSNSISDNSPIGWVICYGHIAGKSQILSFLHCLRAISIG